MEEIKELARQIQEIAENALLNEEETAENFEDIQNIAYAIIRLAEPPF